MKAKDLFKNKQTLFLVILILLLGLIFLQLFLPKKIPLKSKAEEPIPLIFEPSSLTAGNNADFTLTIKLAPATPLTIQLFKINLNFDKDKVNVKANGINYIVGQASTALGADDNTTIADVNNRGTIKLYGEIVNPAYGLVINGTAEIVRITFTSKSTNNYLITNSNSSITKINADFTVSSLPLSNTILNVNPNQTELTPSAGVSLYITVKFQGILEHPPINQQNSLLVKVTLITPKGERVSKDSEFFVYDIGEGKRGFWSSNVNFNVLPGSGYTILIKGPKHIQKKICDQKPQETYPGSYHCGEGKIELKEGVNNLDFSGIYQLVGDLPDQDGVVNAYDVSLIRNCLNQTASDCLRLADLNLDGVVNAQDYSLVIAALSVRTDEE